MGGQGFLTIRPGQARPRQIRSFWILCKIKILD